MKNKSMALQPPKTYLKQEQKNKKNELNSTRKRFISDMTKNKGTRMHLMMGPKREIY